MRINIEDQIRDKLIKNLNILEDDLEFLDKEKFLPNHLGTRSFIDILAKDSQNRYVIIELKRSKESSREALHEVLKYIEGIKENKSLRDDEIYTIIVSTEWSELLVPFSSFVKKTDISINGYLLNIDEDYTPISSEKVKPLLLNNDRLLSDIHSIHLYENEENLKKGIESHKESLSKKNIDDYIFVILKAHPDFCELAKSAVFSNLKEISKKDDDAIYKMLENMPNYKYIIYRAIQVLNEDHYYDIIKKDKEGYAEVKEMEDMYEGESLLQFLHEYAIDNTKPLPYSDMVEIGYPSKFTKKLLEDEQWDIIELIRNGRFLNNSLLTDNTILGEIGGDSGTNNQRYCKEFSSKNISSFEEISKSVEICLKDNNIWKMGILNAIKEVNKNLYDEFNGIIQIYNPSNTILSIYQYITSDNMMGGLRWIPNYLFVLEQDDMNKKIYIGHLDKNNNKCRFQSILDNYYESNSFGLLHLMSWGGYEYRDVEIASSYGLEYANLYISIEDNIKTMYRFNGFDYVEINDIGPFESFIEFINGNEKFVNDIYSFYDKNTLVPGVFMSENTN